jgi:DNA-binding MarR family transcriptional regulator
MRKHANHRGAVETEAVFHSLLRTMGLLRQLTEPYFSRFGVSAPQWDTLRVLHRAERQGRKDLRPTDLAERLLIQPPSVTGVVDRLERHGLVKRTLSRTDMRVRQVSLTPRGRKLVGEVLVGHSAHVQSLFAGLTPGERDGLRDGLKGLETHLSALIRPGKAKNIDLQRNLEDVSDTENPHAV